MFLFGPPTSCLGLDLTHSLVRELLAVLPGGITALATAGFTSYCVSVVCGVVFITGCLFWDGFVHVCAIGSHFGPLLLTPHSGLVTPHFGQAVSLSTSPLCPPASLTFTLSLTVSLTECSAGSLFHSLNVLLCPLTVCVCYTNVMHCVVVTNCLSPPLPLSLPLRQLPLTFARVPTLTSMTSPSPLPSPMFEWGGPLPGLFFLRPKHL